VELFLFFDVTNPEWHTQIKFTFSPQLSISHTFTHIQKNSKGEFQQQENKKITKKSLSFSSTVIKNNVKNNNPTGVSYIYKYKK
jgi:hypothetical protein